MASTAKALKTTTPAKTTPSKKASRPTPKLKVVTNPTLQTPKPQGFGAAFEHTPTPTFICGSDWTIKAANHAATAVLEDWHTGLSAAGGSWKSFDPHTISGANLSTLFADEPGEFRSFVASSESKIAVGPYFAEFYATALPDGGWIVTWSDATAKRSEETKTSQIFSAIEDSNTCFMLTDKDLKLVYMNKRLAASLKDWEPELQKLFGPGFKADALMGRCIDEFHKNPAHQRRMLANESMFPFNTRIEVGPLRIDLAVNALRDKAGSIVGYSTEWVNVTDRLAEEEDYKARVKEIAERMNFLKSACSTDLADAMEALSRGDLTVVITPRTPLLDIPKQEDLAVMAETFNDLRNQTVKAVDAYNRARESMSNLILETRQGAESIARASNEVSVGNDDLAQRTEEQASSLEETASSMEEMTSTVKQNADNAKQANQLAMQAKESAEKGGRVVSEAVSTMDEINKASKRIADIISVIDEIAFQTNLLALNAAVEAARVGEQGRGFAVVAGEVRNLAGRSATAAKEIKSLVQDSVQKVQEGAGLVNQSGQQLDEIVNSVKKVADIISEIAAAAQEQAEGIEQVNKAVMQMDEITQQNAALVEEASTTSESMHQQALTLQDLVGQFTLDASLLAALEASRVAQAPKASPARTALKAKETKTSTKPSRPTKSEEADEFEEF